MKQSVKYKVDIIVYIYNPFNIFSVLIFILFYGQENATLPYSGLCRVTAS